jgi:IS30 family transposase
MDFQPKWPGQRVFPKKKNDLSALTDQEVEQFLNDRPVRKFNYKTPNQVLQGKIALIT